MNFKGLDMLYDEYVRLYDEEDVALEHIVKSDFTKLIAIRDCSRDETTMGLFRYIDAFQPTENIVEASDCWLCGWITYCLPPDAPSRAPYCLSPILFS